MTFFNANETSQIIEKKTAVKTAKRVSNVRYTCAGIHELEKAPSLYRKKEITRKSAFVLIINAISSQINNMSQDIMEITDLQIDAICQEQFGYSLEGAKNKLKSKRKRDLSSRLDQYVSELFPKHMEVKGDGVYMIPYFYTELSIHSALSFLFTFKCERGDIPEYKGKRKFPISNKKREAWIKESKSKKRKQLPIK